MALAFLFAVTLFASAVLLFWVQPLVAKMLLPLLGGTPAVWNTCMLFFQAVLLAGYAYVLVITRWLGARPQAAAHVALLVAAALFLPPRLSAASVAVVPAQSNPVFWLLGQLLLSVGLPFFAISASAPLLQNWFSKTRHASASDPYFLYAASNAGSLSALVCFPLLLEPNLTLGGQAVLWAEAYAALVILVLACAVVVLRRGRASETKERETAATRVESVDERGEAHERIAGSGAGVTTKRRSLWMLLAFAPSSLVLGATTYVTTDVAAVPLLWVIPLALYLLTFVLAFARRSILTLNLMGRVLPGAAIILTLVYLSGATEPAWFLVPIHLLFLFVAAFVCHARLAEDRPPTAHLPEFYFWIAAGGALGGVFNALVAPVLFNSVVEYPLVVVLVCLLRPVGSGKREDSGATKRGFLKFFSVRRDDAERVETEIEKARAGRLDFLLPIGMGLACAVLAIIVARLEIGTVERVAISIGLPLMLLNHFFTKRRTRFALGLGALMLASAMFAGSGVSTLHRERNFFGALRISEEEGGAMRLLHHGSTLHGRQFTDAARRCEPLSYYHRTGPVGSIFKAFDARGPVASNEVAAVGLGTGASAAYSTTGQRWTFYEINPAVVRLAGDRRYFTYLSDCAAAPVAVELGDARLKLREAAEARYALIILDAFSSDAIPAHLLTREAVSLYLSKLAAGGWIAFHVSNRSLDLHAVVGGLARDAGLQALVFDDLKYDATTGKDASEWVVLARRAEDLRELEADARWRALDEHERRFKTWSDDFSDIVGVFKWRL
jgi:hypothetical protein